MNTIRRPRKRPRVTSSNLRAFWWLVAREASWCVLAGDSLYYHSRGRQKRFTEFTTQRVTRAALVLLKLRDRKRCDP